MITFPIWALNGGVTLPLMAKASRNAAVAKSSPTLENGKDPSRRRNRKASEPRSRAAPYSSVPVDLKAGLLHVARLKNGIASTHPIRGPELRALRELKRDYSESPYLFVSELGGPLTPATVRKLITRAGEKAKLPFPIHPHMLRHSTGYKLANDGQDTRAIQQYLGHRNITHTVRYTELSPERFKGFWRD
jgi:type 1 fimbriae regulatory protein FimE